jgi:pilus assembly protein CpaF
MNLDMYQADILYQFKSPDSKFRPFIVGGLGLSHFGLPPVQWPEARKNILVTGGTGTGKTTLVNILGKFIPPDERILLIEDTSEIQMDQDNLVRFEARQPQNGLPAVSIRDLLKAALRHRPDRIILGEIRGGEAFDLLQLLNTGHSGSLSTVHATSAKQGLARFTSCVLQSGVELPYRAIKSNIGIPLTL